MQLKLSNCDLFVELDEEDYTRLMHIKWQFNYTTGYVYRNVFRRYNHKSVYIHQDVLGSKYIDHINHNKLDNTKKNLRLSSHSLNAANRKKLTSVGGKTCSSKYKGVCFNKQRNKWQAYIKKDGKNKFLGFFEVEEQAAIAYDKAAVITFGSHALLNLPC